MRQALHILRKDLRGHWYEIAVTLAVTAAFAFTGAAQAAFWRQGGESHGIAFSLILFLLPLTWWALIARVIHSEALPGDKQFWLTRPYQRGSLLLAKTLLILLCVNLPMLFADTIIVTAYGFPLSQVLPGLAWSQVLLTAVFLLPVAALSAITTGLVQLLLALSTIAVPMLAWALITPGMMISRSWFTLEWVRTYFDVMVAAMAALVILIWQYARRKTASTRSIAVAAVILIMVDLAIIPWTAAFWVQSKLSKQDFDESGIQVAFNAKRKWAATAGAETDGVRLNIPLRVEGTPSGTYAEPEGLTATFIAPDGTTWRTPDEPRANVTSEGQLTSLRIKLDKTFYERVKDAPVTVRGALYLTVFGNGRTTRLTSWNQSQDVPGAGRCMATQSPNGQSYFLLCDSAFRAPKDFVSAEWVNLEKGAQLIRPFSCSPFPADLGINPIYQYSTYFVLQGPVSAVDVTTTEPLAFIRRGFELKDLRLADFERH